MTREIIMQDQIRPSQEGEARAMTLVYLTADGGRRHHPIGTATLAGAFAQAHQHAQEGESFLNVEESPL